MVQDVDEQVVQLATVEEAGNRLAQEVHPLSTPCVTATVPAKPVEHLHSPSVLEYAPVHAISAQLRPLPVVATHVVPEHGVQPVNWPCR